MRVLFTGASSFTGYWFVRTLCRAGHDVVATFRRGPQDYADVRALRVAEVLPACRPVFHCAFGDRSFLELVSAEAPWDMLCHHAADTTDYKSSEFNITAAVENNTRNVAAVLSALRDGGCRKVLLTGSVFEKNEGAGSDGMRAFSPYGLSKGITEDIFRYYTDRYGLHLGKFVIPNPFGPYEDPRFTAYLMRTWSAGDVATVKTPDYVRDNIHVSLLARAYAKFAQRLPNEPGFQKLNPNGYIESQGCFAERFARSMRARLDLECRLEVATQTEFSEPRVRVNTEPATAYVSDWDEVQAWDEVADYYRGSPHG